MKLVEQTKFFLNLFFALGQSPYPIIFGRCLNLKYISNRFIAIIPAFIINGICITVAIKCCYTLNTIGKWTTLGKGSSDIILTNFNALAEILRALIVFGQCYCHKETLFDIMQMFRKIETIFANNLKHRISYTALCKQSRIRTILILGAYSQSTIIPFTQLIQYGKYDPIILQFKLLQSMTSIAYLHIVFYIDTLCYFLAQLDFVIQRDAKMVVNKKSPLYYLHVRDSLKYYKIIYFRLWEINQELNYYFGWSLVILFLKTFVHLVFTIYWQVIQARKPDELLKLFRMSLKNVLIFCRVFFNNIFVFFAEPLTSFLSTCMGVLVLVNSCYFLTEAVSL